jgi:hypothetical protein
MSQPIVFTIRTGNAQADYRAALRYQEAYESQGLRVQITAAPTGGYEVRASPPSLPAHGLGGTLVVDSSRAAAPQFGSTQPAASWSSPTPSPAQPGPARTAGAHLAQP